MTATDDFIRELRADIAAAGPRCPHEPLPCPNYCIPEDVNMDIDPTTLRLLLDLVDAAPKPQPCSGWDEEKDGNCGKLPVWFYDINDWGEEWRCEDHKMLDTPTPIGMAALALEAHLKERAR